MKRTLHSFGFAALISATSAFAQGSPGSPVGTWKTIDDKTGKVRSLVKIAEVGGELRGKIDKLIYGPDDKPNPVCEKCEGAEKDAPIVGLTILKGFKKGPDGQWQDGEVLDPENGKTYRSRLSPTEDGKKLEVRGYIGSPIFGRSQVWVRE